MIEPTFEINSAFIFPMGGNTITKVTISHKIQICNTIQMGNLLLVRDPEVTLTNEQIQELVISERMHLN
jgi:hypothetical protein